MKLPKSIIVITLHTCSVSRKEEQFISDLCVLA